MEDQFIFVTGTDTNIGKTFVTKKILEGLASQGKTVLGLKPIASGSEETEQGLCNRDALILQAASSKQLPYAQINPQLFHEPISPNIALQRAKHALSLKAMDQHIYTDETKAFDHVLIEGVGSLMSPITEDNQSNLEWVLHLGIPVILVVGIKLGCMGHAQLCAKVLKSHHVPVLGWVANRCDAQVLYPDEIVENLQQLLGYPFLADIAHEQ